MKCRYCHQDSDFPCVNTRDMTDFAISGNDKCMSALEQAGWGDMGKRYVVLNRKISDLLDARDMQDTN